jgi:hypothetical protein
VEQVGVSEMELYEGPSTFPLSLNGVYASEGRVNLDDERADARALDAQNAGYT